ncbi:MAG TPA: M67 family metallopeptidase [Thermoanaerobaculia bacterium]|nr:M67 family metallopeptidase [Thermoanaerobaculia bacterium]
MSRLVLLPRHLTVIHRHASATYPEECCGVLVGRELRGIQGVFVERVLSVGNAREESRENRFLIPPETVLAAQKEARAAGLDVVGYYHSHPDHPARPSEFDREHAWPGLSYLIVSVEKGQAVETRSWRLAEDRSRFDEEAVDHRAPVTPASFRSPAKVAEKEAV